MNVLINAGAKVGGGISVTDSICSYLYKFPEIKFFVVLSKYCKHIGPKIENFDNVKVFNYDLSKNFRTIILHRDKFLDDMVDQNNIDVVFSVFGPSMWTPRCKHLLGFARPHIVWPESPYFNIIPITQKIKEKLYFKIVLWCFRRNSNYFWSENNAVSERLHKLIKGSIVYTVTGYYHQIYDHQDNWQMMKLPVFNGTSLLCIAAPYPHKNLPITVDVAKILAKKHPDFNFRFVLTLKPDELKGYDESLKEYFTFVGRVKIEQCPTLYTQCDFMWMPTLLECFSGTYAEAMRMETPTITTDLPFAHGCCGDAAMYFSPLDAEQAADAIYALATNKELRDNQVKKGKKQLKTFNNAEERASLLIGHLKEIANKN